MKTPLTIFLLLAGLLGPVVPTHAVEEPFTPAARDSDASWIGVLLSDAGDGSVKVAAVVPEGPADRAGLLPGDALLSLDEVPITTRADVADRLRSAPAGRSVAVAIRRGAVLLDKVVVPVTRPPSMLAGTVDVDDDAPRITRVPRVASAALILSLRDLVGLQLAEISPELRSHFGAKREAGLLVTRVRAGSPAEKASVLVGDVLESACGEDVGSTMQFRTCLLRSGPAEVIPLVVVRGRERLGLSLRIDEGGLLPMTRDPLIETRADLARAAAAAAERADEMRKQVLREEIERLRRRLAALEAELERLQ